MTRWVLITLALGEDEARKVDTAIPQGVHDTMTESAIADIAGWYYAPEAKLFGRLLTQSECWVQIRKKLEGESKLHAYMLATDVTVIVSRWPCLRQHVERGEITLQNGGAR